MEELFNLADTENTDIVNGIVNSKSKLHKFIVWRKNIESGQNNYVTYSDVDDYLAHADYTLENHEVIHYFKPRKFFLDIDCSHLSINDEGYYCSLIKYIKAFMVKEFNNQYSNHGYIIKKSDIIEVTAHGHIIHTDSNNTVSKKYKFSTNLIIYKYLIFDYANFKHLGKAIIHAFKNDEGIPDTEKIIIDTAQFDRVNNYAGSINNRLIGSHKGGQRVKISSAKTKACIITDATDTTTLPDLFASNEKAAATSKYVNAPDIPDEYVEKILAIAGRFNGMASFQFSKVKGNIIVLTRLAPSNCIICSREHEKSDAYLIIIAGSIYFGCYRSPTRDKYYIGQSHDYHGASHSDSNSDQNDSDSSSHHDNSSSHFDSYDKYTADTPASLLGTFQKLGGSKFYNECADIIGPYAYMDARINLIKAEMKMGKTKSLINHISECNYKKIIIISFRKTFSTEASAKFGKFELYSDIKGDIMLADHPKIIIQIESLHRLKNSLKSDLLILDEAESIWAQFSSCNFINFSLSMSRFEALMLNAGKVICMDANLSDRTLNILAKIYNGLSNTSLYINTKNPSNGYKYNICSKQVILAQLQEFLADKCNVAIFTNSLAEAERLHAYISKIISSSRIAQYNSKTLESIKRTHFSNVNKYWAQFQCIICTPTVSAGVSFEATHFDYVFGFFTNKSCSIETCRQMLGRVRNVAERKIYLHIAHSSCKYEYNVAEIKKLIQQDKLELFAGENINALSFTINDSNTAIDPIDKIAFEIITQNIAHNNKSRTHFYEAFLQQIKGEHLDSYARVEVLSTNVDEKGKQNYETYQNSAAAHKDAKYAKLQAAEKISREQFSGFKLRIRNQEDVTEAEHYMVKKYRVEAALKIDLNTSLAKIFSAEAKLLNLKMLRELYSPAPIEANIKKKLQADIKATKNEYKSKFIDFRSGIKHKICFELTNLFVPPLDMAKIPLYGIQTNEVTVDAAKFKSAYDNNVHIFDIQKRPCSNPEECYTAMAEILKTMYGFAITKDYINGPDFVNFKYYGAYYRRSVKKNKEGYFPIIELS
jgi:hypothetical protein